MANFQAIYFLEFPRWCCSGLRNVVCALLFPAAFAMANVVVYDPFSDGGVTNGVDANDIAWTNLTSGSSLAVNSAGIQPGTGNYLQLTSTSTFSGAVGALPSDPMLNLDMGQTLTLTLKFTYTSATLPNAANTLRFGLTDSTGAGTGVSIGTGTNSSLSLRQDRNAFVNSDRFGGPQQDFVEFNSVGDSFVNGTMSSGLQTDTAYSLLLSITRLASSMSILAQVNGGEATAIDFDDTPDTNNTIGRDFITNFSGGAIIVRNGNTNSSFRLDDVTVTVIPEPGSIALLGLGCFLLMIKRRTGIRF